jgi:hypothetical protein
LVVREGDKFKVSTPSLRGRQTSYTVWRDNGSPNGIPSKVKCNCLEFEEEFPKDASFRCEHILAVKYHVENVRREEARKAAQNESIEQADTIPQGFSIADTDGGSYNIRYANKTTVIPFAVQVNKQCPDQKETAEKIVEFLNQLETQVQAKPKIYDGEFNEKGFPKNPIAKSLSDLMTAKQIGLIRALCREQGLDADAECEKLMQCKHDELSKRAASCLIDYLNGDK